jgi:dTDP-4-amino-4,6-dideoxygalactose transaminase
MNMKLLDLVAQNGRLRADLIEKFCEIIDSANFRLGPKIERFEKYTIDYLSCGHALAVSSGTDVLLMALMAMIVGRGTMLYAWDISFFGRLDVPHDLELGPCLST